MYIVTSYTGLFLYQRSITVFGRKPHRDLLVYVRSKGAFEVRARTLKSKEQVKKETTTRNERVSVDEEAKRKSRKGGRGRRRGYIHENIPYKRVSRVSHNKGGKVWYVCFQSECKSNESFPAVERRVYVCMYNPKKNYLAQFIKCKD